MNAYFIYIYKALKTYKIFQNYDNIYICVQYYIILSTVTIRFSAILFYISIIIPTIFITYTIILACFLLLM